MRFWPLPVPKSGMCRFPTHHEVVSVHLHIKSEKRGDGESESEI